MILFALKQVQHTATQDMTVVGYTAELVYFEPHGTPLGDLVAFSTDPITQGRIDITLYRNAFPSASVHLSPTAPLATATITAKFLEPGDHLTATAEPSADLLPDATCDLVAIVLKG